MERAAVFDSYPSPGGRGGTARRWVRGLFADYAFVALSVYWILDFGGALAFGLFGLRYGTVLVINGG